MYAIIETGGKQYWVVPGDTLKVEKLEAKEGTELTLDALWAASEGQDAGKKAPAGQAAKVTIEVVRQVKGPKLIVFKKRPKKIWYRKRGHRQALTEIRVKNISFN
ncbi:MAG TPA: 50S ribosomal protein L21 [Elusimicrobia bacterium]|nr:MAG: 50S ribosomal protein L21 [Elusimicrobia bacterium RIFOXYB2_FULL_62_6]HAH06294.1 50S ribosomal protein L21 [Elusimicrobiota bacterium]